MLATQSLSRNLIVCLCIDANSRLSTHIALACRQSGPHRCGARALSHRRRTQRGQRLQVQVSTGWHTSKALFEPCTRVSRCAKQCCIYICCCFLLLTHGVFLQVQATAEVLSRPDTHIHADRFNFKGYMASRAELVNEALEASVPLQYPEDVVESMRSGSCTFIAVIACQANLPLL